MNRVAKYWWVLIVILGFTPLVWFLKKGDVLIDGVDTNFPLNPTLWLLRRFFVWNSLPNAGVDFSSSTAGIFFHSLQVILTVVGFSLQNVELLTLVFWFLAIVLSAFLFAAVLVPGKRLLQLLFVVLYSFNIYLFNTWENIKVANLSLYVALPLVLAVLLGLKEKKISLGLAMLLTSFSSIIVSGAGINPSYFLVLLLAIAIYTISELLVDISVRNAVYHFKYSSLVLAIILLVNMFWILPTITYVTKNISPGGSIYEIGFTNWIDSLSENTSLLNVARIQGAWDWYSVDEATGLPLYIPYSLRYFKQTPFVLFSFIIPALSMISLMFVKKRTAGVYIMFASMMALGIFLGAGTHQPSGAIYKYLLDHLPFFSLFRSPWYIFTPLLIFAYSGLSVLLFDRIYAYNALSLKPILKTALSVFIFVLIAGNLVYSYPLVLGRIFRPNSPDSFYIRFPEYVFSAAKWLDDNPDGRVISFPEDDIEKFDWGYRGVESILQLISDKEFLFSPLNSQDSPVSLVVKELYSSLKKGQWDAVYSLSSKMNASLVFYKDDQVSLSKGLFNPPASLEHVSFGPWSFYKIPAEKSLGKIYVPGLLNVTAQANQIPRSLAFLKKEELLLNSADSVVGSNPLVFGLSGKVVIAENLQARDAQNFESNPSDLSSRLVIRKTSPAGFVATFSEGGEYEVRLENYKLGDFGIVPGGGLPVSIDGKEDLLPFLEGNDSFVTFGPVLFSPGKHQIDISTRGENLLVGGGFENGYIFDKDGSGEYEIVSDTFGNNMLSIANRGKRDISAYFNIRDFDPLGLYCIQVRYKQIYGGNPLLLVDQHAKDTLIKSQAERFPNYPEWNTVSFYYRPVGAISSSRVGLIAPTIEDPFGTKILYDDLSVNRVFTNDILFIKKGKQQEFDADIMYSRVSPVEYRGEITSEDSQQVIIFSENYSPDWKLSVIGANGSIKRTDIKHFSVNAYQNGWMVTGGQGTYSFKIYYEPQRIYVIGGIVSGIALLSLISVSLVLSARSRYMTNDKN